MADGVLVYRGEANAVILDAGDSLVMLDSGGRSDTSRLHEAVRRWRRDLPVTTVVFSHHHIDHVFGVSPFEAEAEVRGWPPPEVVAHEALERGFERYRRTRGWNRAINVRQFGWDPDATEWPAQYRRPDRTYRDDLNLARGCLTLELHHALGETDDATWTWVPGKGLLHCADLLSGVLPNAGNPQKVQRFALEWAQTLRRMAALRPRMLVPGHGDVVVGAEENRDLLGATAEVLESLESQTVELMNRGATLARILDSVRLPDHLRAHPALQARYDHPDFIVHNIWRRYGGWYEGEPDRLLPAAREVEATEWVSLAGGLEAVLRRAQLLAHGQGQDLALACHLAETAVLAAPASQAAHETRASVYERRAEAEPALLARNLFLAAARASRSGRRDLFDEPPHGAKNDR